MKQYYEKDGRVRGVELMMLKFDTPYGNPAGGDKTLTFVDEQGHALCDISPINIPSLFDRPNHYPNTRQHQYPSEEEAGAVFEKVCAAFVEAGWAAVPA